MLYSKKGQSAIEYLMTYGWMLVAVSIAGGAVYSTVGAECPETASGFVGQDIQVEDFGSGEQLDLVLSNGDAEEITIEEVEVTDPDTGEGRLMTDEQDIGVSDTEVVGFSAVEETDACNTLEIDIRYSISDALENQVATGTITTSTELIDLDPPASPTNLEANY